MFHASVLLERATRNAWGISDGALQTVPVRRRWRMLFFFLFSGRERIADPMRLSPLTVRRGEGEFPLVGVHRIRWWCWVRCMVYPPPSTIISPTTAFLKISFPGPWGCVCSLEGMYYVAAPNKPNTLNSSEKSGQQNGILDIKERMKPPSWVKKIIYHREHLRKVRFSQINESHGLNPILDFVLPGNSNNAGFLVSKSQTKYGWSAHVL